MYPVSLRYSYGIRTSEFGLEIVDTRSDGGIRRLLAAFHVTLPIYCLYNNTELDSSLKLYHDENASCNDDEVNSMPETEVSWLK